MSDVLLGWLVVLAIAAPLVPPLLLATSHWVAGPSAERVVHRSVIGGLAVAFVALITASVGWWLSGRAVVDVELGSWFSAGGYHFPLGVRLDRISVPIALTVVSLCTLVARFSIHYLHRERGYTRFFALLSVAAAGLLCVTLSNGYDQLFLGWECLGLSSVFLVAFFHERAGPPVGALRVLSTYRFCDLGLLGAGVLLHGELGSGEYERAFSWGRDASQAELSTLVCLGLLLAATGKSALFPLGGWLPRAMEGPTPSPDRDRRGHRGDGVAEPQGLRRRQVHPGDAAPGRHATLRYYQFLRAPSALQDALRRAALGRTEQDEAAALWSASSPRRHAGGLSPGDRALRRRDRAGPVVDRGRSWAGALARPARESAPALHDRPVSLARPATRAVAAGEGRAAEGGGAVMGFLDVGAGAVAVAAALAGGGGGPGPAARSRQRAVAIGAAWLVFAAALVLLVINGSDDAFARDDIELGPVFLWLHYHMAVDGLNAVPLPMTAAVALAALLSAPRSDLRGDTTARILVVEARAARRPAVVRRGAAVAVLDRVDGAAVAGHAAQRLRPLHVI